MIFVIGQPDQRDHLVAAGRDTTVIAVLAKAIPADHGGGYLVAVFRPAPPAPNSVAGAPIDLDQMFAKAMGGGR